MADDLDFLRDYTELFTDLFADARQGSAAGADLVFFGDVMNDIHLGIGLGDGPTHLLAAGVTGHFRGLRLLFVDLGISLVLHGNEFRLVEE